MLLPRSRLAAAAPKRARLMPPWLIALLGLMLLVALVAIYPFKALVERITTARKSDPLTIAYVRNLLRADPGNQELQRAWKLLTAPPPTPDGPASRSPEGIRLAWQRLLDREAALRLMAPGSPLQLTLAAEVRQDLHRLADEPLEHALLIELFRKAQAYDEEALAQQLFLRVESERPDLGAHWFGEAAAQVLGDGDYRVAAKLYGVARARSANLEDERRYFTRQIGALRGGELMVPAVEAAESQLGSLAKDKETLLFLVELFRAANRPDLAEKYTRMLLRLSLEDMVAPQTLLAALNAGVRRTAATESSADELPPLDERIYRSSYDVFLANRRLEDAFALANAAVKRWPDDSAWRERLARVSEWTGRPRIALEQWRTLARQGNAAAWSGVLRLAPGLMDDEALVEAQRWQLTQRPGDTALVKSLAEALERLGRPKEALAILREHQKRHPSRGLAELAGQLAERSGSHEDAIRQLRAANSAGGYTGDRVNRLAVLLLLANRRSEAWDVLRAARPSIPESDPQYDTYLRLLAEVARTQQDDEVAASSLKNVVSRGKGTEYDYSVLSTLLRDSLPLESALVAEEGWKQFRKPYLLLSSLGTLARLARWADMGRLFASLNQTDLAAFSEEPEFLRLRSQYFQYTNRYAAARRDLERALGMDPESLRLRESLLWLLIDSYDGDALRKLLGRVERDWSRDPDLHDALAAAHVALSEPRAALTYLTPQLPSRKNDFLWVMQYAETLEQNGEVDRAWQLKQAIWKKAAWRINGARRDAPPQALEAALRAARMRLAAAGRGGDGHFALLRTLLRGDRGGASSLDSAEKELVLAWFQEMEQPTAARAWLWSRYARTLAHPLWARISSALNEEDRDALAGLLDLYATRFPRYDRVTGAERVGRGRDAQTFAFEALDAQPHDDLSHQQVRETLLGNAHRLGLGFITRDVGVLSERERQVGLEWSLRPGLTLLLGAGNTARISRDAAVLAWVPAAETWSRAGLAWRTETQTTQVFAEARSGMAGYNPVRLSTSRALPGGVSLDASLGYRAPATESAALRVAGTRDYVEASLGVPLSGRDRITLDLGAQRFNTQFGDPLGNGRRVAIEFDHALRLEQPDLHVSAFARRYTFSSRDGGIDPRLQALVPEGASAQVATFVPLGFSLFGLRASTGLGLNETYTRAVRPFLSSSLVHNSVTGAGWGLSAGLTGSVLGNDQVTVGWLYDRGGSSAYNRTRELGLRYQLFF